EDVALAVSVTCAPGQRVAEVGPAMVGMGGTGAAGGSSASASAGTVLDVVHATRNTPPRSPSVVLGPSNEPCPRRTSSSSAATQRHCGPAPNEATVAPSKIAPQLVLP